MTVARLLLFVAVSLAVVADTAHAQVTPELRDAMQAREVWTRESGAWMVVMSQVTTARP